jgi:hypothetical protein
MSATLRPESSLVRPLGIAAALACLYLMFSPVWFPRLAPRMYDNARALELAMLCAVCLTVAAPSVSRAVAEVWLGLRAGVRWLLLAFLAGGALSALASAAPHTGIQQVALNVQLVAVLLLVCAAVRNEGAMVEKPLAVAIFAGAALFTLKFWTTCILYFLEGKQFSWVSPFMDFANVRFFGQYQAYVLLLMALPVPLLALRGFWRFVAYFMAANFWALQWMVGSRAVWVGFVAAMAVTTLALPGKRRQWVVMQVIPMAVGGLIFAAFSWSMQASPRATPIPAINSVMERSGESNTERLILAQSALGLAARHPLTGVGPGQFGVNYAETRAAHPHNSPLQLLAEYGVPSGTAGILLGALLVMYAVVQIRRRSLQRFDPVSTALGAAVIMGLVDALFSGNLIMPHSQVCLAIIAGWLLGRQRPAPAMPYVSPERQRQWRVGLALTVAGAAAVSAVLAFEYLSLIVDMPYPPALRIPNFWQYGRFTAW